MLKPSKYNYMTKNKDGGLLLFNSFYTSFGRVSPQKASMITDLLNELVIDDSNYPLISNDCFDNLKRMGFLIPDEENEDIKLNLFKQENDNNLQLTILPTEQCNFRCAYCYEEFKRGKMSNETQETLIKFVKKNIHNYTGLRVEWFGGEPLLAMDVIENLSQAFMEICKKMMRTYVAGMTTNGYLLNLPIFQRLLKNKVISYQITLDGLKETHDRQRPLANGSATFDTIIMNLKNIKDNIKTGRFAITIRTNVSKEIYNNLDQYIDLIDELFVNDQRFSFLIRPAGDWGGETVKDFTDSFVNGSELGMVLENFIMANNNFNIINKGSLSPAGSKCYASNPNSFVIDSDGNVRKCTCHLEDMDRNKVGVLKKEGIIEFDYYRQAQWLDAYDADECKECYFLPACQMKNCIAQKICSNRGFYECPYEKKSMDQTLQLLNKTEQFTKIC